MIVHKGKVIPQGKLVSTVARQPFEVGANEYDTIPVQHSRLLAAGLRDDIPIVKTSTPLERKVLGL